MRATTYDSFADEYFAHLTADPNVCVALGVSARLGDLPDPSLEGMARSVEEARGLLAKIAEIDAPALSFDQRLDLDLARLTLEREIHDCTYTFNGRLGAQQLPDAGDGIGDGVFLMFINDPRPAADRLADITARIEKAPAFLDAMLARLDTPVARWVDIDVQKIEGLPDLFKTVTDWAAAEGWPGLPRLQAAVARAEPAMQGYLERLKAMPTTTQLHLGPQTAREIVRLRGIDKSLEELHAYARRFLARNAQEIEVLRRQLVEKYGLAQGASTEDLHTFLNERFAVQVPGGRLEAVLDRYQAEREKILAFIRERDLFPVFDEQEMKILRTPDFMAPSIPAGAMMPPAPFREGVRTSLVYLTLSDELLDEHTELGIPTMMIHEGIPGHHLQLATASRHPSIIRRSFDALEHAEGWTTMLEDYMLDAGYLGELADEARFICKRDIARIGARVAIDLFFMTGERRFLDVGVGVDTSDADPFAAAGRLLKVVTGFTDARVQAELNWYSQERGYPLSYLTGNTLVWELKRDLQAAGRIEGERLDREFHRIYLQSGNMPLRFLRQVFAHEGLLQ